MSHMLCVFIRLEVTGLTRVSKAIAKYPVKITTKGASNPILKY